MESEFHQTQLSIWCAPVERPQLSGWYRYQQIIHENNIMSSSFMICGYMCTTGFLQIYNSCTVLFQNFCGGACPQTTLQYYAPSKLFTATLRALLLSISAWIRSWSPARVCLNGCDDIIYLPLVLAMHTRWYTGQCVCGCKCIVSALVSHVASSSSA